MSSARKQQRNVVRQIAVQRKNLVAVCRLAVKSLIERSCFEPIDDGGEELYNFCAIMEHVLSHRLKPHQTWYGFEEPRPFWDYIRSTCRNIPHNCIPSIETVENPKTSRGKGRAWLRTALMEKKLHDYFTHALQQTRATRSYYSDGALLLSEDCNMISGILLGLNAIDFSFDIRGENLDQPGIPVIDFTPYLKFDQIRDVLHDEHRDLRNLGRLMSMSLDSDVFIDENSDTWRGRYLKVDGKFRVVSEQKGYLEELVRLRESQLEEDHRQRTKLLETLHHFEAESRRERQQLEAVIIELQAQLGHVKEEHRLKLQQMQMLLHRYTTQPPTFNPPEIALRDMASLPLVNINSPRKQHTITTTNNELTVVSVVPSIPTSRPAMSAADSKSIISATSSISVASRNDTQSMVPLAGSFTSQVSYMPNDKAFHQAAVPASETNAENSVPSTANAPANHHIVDETSDTPTRRKHSSASAYASPIIRQGHVNEDQDPSEVDDFQANSTPAALNNARIIKVIRPHPHLADVSDSSASTEDMVNSRDDTVIPMSATDRDAPKPDLVTSCDSTFESSERDSEREDAENVPKQRSADDVETIPEDEAVSKPEGSALPEKDEEELVGK